MQVTVSYRGEEKEWEKARLLSQIPTFELKNRKEVNWDEPVLQVNRTGYRVKLARREYRWHPGLLHTRLSAGWSHPLVRAMNLKTGDEVLDCTLGMGTDAAFLSSMTERTVVGIEIEPAVALMTHEGLKQAGHDVTVINADARQFIETLPDNCFDVVQGDPMFPKGTGVTHSLDVLREVGHHEPLGMEWLSNARRVARKRVVVRDIAHGTLLEAMKPDEVLNVGRKRPRYGIWFGTET